MYYLVISLFIIQFYPLIKALTMATGADVRDILELTGGDNDSGPISKKDIINSDKVTFRK